MDVSLISYHLQQDRRNPVAFLQLIAKSFADKGVDVILDANGPDRHHSKRATQERIAPHKIEHSSKY